MLFKATSTSFCPGRQFTQLFKEWETALATWIRGGREAPLSTNISAHWLGTGGDDTQSWNTHGNDPPASACHCPLSYTTSSRPLVPEKMFSTLLLGWTLCLSKGSDTVTQHIPPVPQSQAKPQFCDSNTELSSMRSGSKAKISYTKRNENISLLGSPAEVTEVEGDLEFFGSQLEGLWLISSQWPMGPSSQTSLYPGTSGVLWAQPGVALMLSRNV